MSEAKKFMLIDPEHMHSFSKLIQQQLDPRDKQLPHKEISALDTNMLDIINDTSLPPNAKVQRYNHILTKYLDLNDKPKRESISQGSVIKENTNKDNQRTSEHSLLGITKQYQAKAHNLLQALSNTQRLTINDKGEIQINGNLIPGSNATDIIHGLVNRKFNGRDLKGFQEIKDLIKSSNIPKSLLGNHILSENYIKNVSIPIPLSSSSPFKKKVTRRSTPVSSNFSQIASGKAKKGKTRVWSPY